MFDVKLIFCALLCGTGVLLHAADAASLIFSEAEDWIPGKHLKRNADGIFSVEGKGVLLAASALIPVDVNAVSRLSGEFKALPHTNEKDRMFFGFILYDRNQKRIEASHVNAVKGSESELIAPCGKTDTVLKIRNGSEFKKGRFAVLNARADYSDLPNRTASPIKDAVKAEDGSWIITLKQPIGRDAEAGTPVRAHNGGWYHYAGALAAPIPQQWKKIEGVLSGTAAGDPRRQWYPGTAHARIVLFGSGPSKGEFMAFRNIRFDGSPIPKAAPGTRSVAIPETAYETKVKLTEKQQKLLLNRRGTLPLEITVTPYSIPLKTCSLDNAGVEIQPFNVRYQTTNARSVLKRNEKEETLLALWNRKNEDAKETLTLSIRNLGEKTAFHLNGSYIGEMRTKGSLESIGNLEPQTEVEFLSARVDNTRFVPLDPAAADKPGLLNNAVIRSRNTDIPFLNVKGANFDLGITAGKAAAKDGLVSLRKTDASCVFTVPAEQYTRAWILCAREEDAKKDPALNVRLTRYVNGPGYQGRAWEGMANTPVTLNGTEQKVGEVEAEGRKYPLYLLEVPLKTGQIQDLVFQENRGTHAAMRFGKYLDLELSGRLIERRMPMGDTRWQVDPARKSSVHIFGITLEKPAAELEVVPIQPGNIFHNGEVPETALEVRPKRPGDYRLKWMIRDAENRMTGSGEKKITGGAERIKIPLAQKLPGWYALDFELLDGTRVLLTHQASFALLGQDTRKAEVKDSPYGTWDYGGAHYTANSLDVVGPVLFKAGFRRSAGIQRYPAEARRKWKLAPPVIYTARMGASDAEHIKRIREGIAGDPDVTAAMIFHENAVWPYQMAPELTDQPYDPKNKWKDADKRLAHAMQLGRIFREQFPHLKVTIGNSLAATELIAEAIRGGFPEKYADYMGLEVVSRNNLPERQWDSSLQSADLMLQVAKKFGYDRWKVNACYESNYRLDSLIGAERQAEWYVRDLLLSQAWRFPDIFLAVIMDTGNEYAGSFWGASGLCTRAPYIYPKKSYVAVANATKLLDQVTGYRAIPTGSESVYLAEYPRRDGKTVYALWTSRGTAEMSLRLGNGSYELSDLYGRPVKAEKKGAELFLTAGTAPQYLLADRPIVLSAQSGKRTYPEDVPPRGLTLVQPMNDLSEWTLKQEKEPLLERMGGPFMPYRTQGSYVLRPAKDAEEGDCLELELVKPDSKLPPVVSEYAVLELKKPIVLNGNPDSLGIRVKGNSGWGQVYWIIEDADGKRRISCGTRVHNADVFDYDGLRSVCFDGWNFLSVPLTDASSIPDLSTGSVDNLWEYQDHGKVKMKRPVKLAGIAFAAQSRPLFLTQHKEHRQILRFKDLSVFDQKTRGKKR